MPEASEAAPVLLDRQGFFVAAGAADRYVATVVVTAFCLIMQCMMVVDVIAVRSGWSVRTPEQINFPIFLLGSVVALVLIVRRTEYGHRVAGVHCPGCGACLIAPRLYKLVRVDGRCGACKRLVLQPESASSGGAGNPATVGAMIKDSQALMHRVVLVMAAIVLVMVAEVVLLEWLKNIPPAPTPGPVEYPAGTSH